jgi:amino-acid N-acetyltransferase
MNSEPAAQIRPARSEDRGEVQRLLEAEALDARFAPDEFLVAERDGQLVGCARLRPLDDQVAELASVAVRPAHRGQGLGRRLVDRALDRAQGPVQALCVEPGFFAHLGFEATDEAHPELEAKAQACCADRDPVAMTWRPR